MFNIPPTANVISRPGPSLKSHRNGEARIELGTPGCKESEWLVHYTMAVQECEIMELIAFISILGHSLNVHTQLFSRAKLLVSRLILHLLLYCEDALRLV